jgi:anti-sigma factor NepR-like protein
MKESKSVKTGWADRKAHQSQFAQQTPPRVEAAMQTDAPVRKAGGRLSREDQRRLGDILQRVYDDVIRQGVPDRFRDLLNELEDASDRGQAEATMSSSRGHGQVHTQGAGEDNSESDRLVGAKGLDNPGSKGSH